MVRNLGTPAILLVALLMACGDSPGQPEDALITKLDLAPDSVTPGDTLHARVRVTNPTGEKVVRTGPNGCLFIPRVYRRDSVVSFRHTGWGCTLAITDHEFPSHETVERRFEFPAIRRTAGSDSFPREGEYVLRIEFQVPLSTLSDTFTVIR